MFEKGDNVEIPLEDVIQCAIRSVFNDICFKYEMDDVWVRDYFHRAVSTMVYDRDAPRLIDGNEVN